MTERSSISIAQGSTIDLEAINHKYAEERKKRDNTSGQKRYEELKYADSSRIRSLYKDYWVDHDALDALDPQPLSDGDEVKLLIQGAGFGGLLFAIRFIQQGFKPSQARLVDSAGGFGGTWYWNRFPGLMNDTEAATYLPLLEETGYVPKHRYSYGPETLEYANLLAKKWGLERSGVFRSEVKSYEWEESSRRWVVTIDQRRADRLEVLTVRSQFVVLANGVLNHPKVPRGLEAFEGPMTHTARFDWEATGGTPDNVRLERLKGKRVGLVGTGATAVQVAPELAKWAKELYVFQRTPSAVWAKGQAGMTPEEWETIATGPGWQAARVKNLTAVVAGEPVDENTTRDVWSKLTTYRAIVGGAHGDPVRRESIGAHIDRMLAEDAILSGSVRQRIDEIVRDKATAEALKPWYPTWCKRPTFHDGYLAIFNLPHVHLIHTDGQGVEKATKTGLIASGQEYPLDILILSTGFRSPGDGLGEPSAASNVTVVGRNGMKLAEKWKANGPSTTHGVITSGFPNMFLTGPTQAGASPNFAYAQDVLSQHCAYIAAEGIRRVGPLSEHTVTIEGSVESEERWASVLLDRAKWFAGIGICGQIYASDDVRSAEEDPKAMMKAARGSPYALGMNAYTRILESWREEGSMAGVDVTS